MPKRCTNVTTLLAGSNYSYRCYATNSQGEALTIQRPYVIKDLCIGCGMCEYQCPMGGEAAIQIFTYTEAGGSFG